MVDYVNIMEKLQEQEAETAARTASVKECFERLEYACKMLEVCKLMEPDEEICIPESAEQRWITEIEHLLQEIKAIP